MKKVLPFIILLFLICSCSPHVEEIKSLTKQIEAEFGEPASTHIFDKSGSRSGIDWNPYTYTMIYDGLQEEDALRFLNWLKNQLEEPAPTYYTPSSTANPIVTRWNKYYMSFALEIFLKNIKKRIFGSCRSLSGKNLNLYSLRISSQRPSKIVINDSQKILNRLYAWWRSVRRFFIRSCSRRILYI